MWIVRHIFTLKCCVRMLCFPVLPPFSEDVAENPRVLKNGNILVSWPVSFVARIWSDSKYRNLGCGRGCTLSVEGTPCVVHFLTGRLVSREQT